jgi:hypothetical protein
LNPLTVIQQSSQVVQGRVKESLGIGSAFNKLILVSGLVFTFKIKHIIACPCFMVGYAVPFLGGGTKKKPYLV